MIVSNLFYCTDLLKNSLWLNVSTVNKNIKNEWIAHIAEASRRLETEGGVEMTWDEEKYIMQNNTNIHGMTNHNNQQYSTCIQRI